MHAALVIILLAAVESARVTVDSAGSADAPLASRVFFTGLANPRLASAITHRMGLSLGNLSMSTFADGETAITLWEDVRGRDVVLISSTSPPVNDHLVQLLLTLSTARRGGARTLTAVIPYFGYSRQDRQTEAGGSAAASDVVLLLGAVGVGTVITVDLHSPDTTLPSCPPHVQLHDVQAADVGARHYSGLGLQNLVVVSPDRGGVRRAQAFAAVIGQGRESGPRVVALVKQRSEAGVVHSVDLPGGEDVRGADVVIVDDIIDTAGTLCAAAELLAAHGARRVFAFATHGVFSRDALTRIAASVLTAVAVTDTIPLTAAAEANEKVTQLSVADVLAAHLGGLEPVLPAG